jgi:hypothetical protein
VSDDRPLESDPEIQRRLDAIVGRFPDRFSPDQIEQIRDRVARSIGFGARLRQTQLANGTGPWFDPRAMTDE